MVKYNISNEVAIVAIINLWILGKKSKTLTVKITTRISVRGDLPRV